MRYSNRLMGRIVPFIPLSGSNAGLLERRFNAASWLGLSDDAEQNGDWDREASSTMLLDTDTDYHNNHGEDPATETLNITDLASSVWDFNRSATHNVTFSDAVHVAKDGVESIVSEYNLTANETINVGQPVFVSANNTVNLADASTLNTSHVLGLAVTDASTNTAVQVLSDGKVERNDWTSIVGTSNLVAGATYYLGTTAGKMTTAPPTGDNEHVVRCGTAVSATKFDIEINEVAIL